MKLCSYLAYIQVNELLAFHTQCLEYSWNEKQDTGTINKPHSYSHMSSPSHHDGWLCQGEGQPGTKADHLGLLSGYSCSDKMESLQEETSCWLKGFVQVSLQDDTPKWSRATCISFSLLFNFSLSVGQYFCCYRSNQKVKRRTKWKISLKKVDFLLIQ